MQTLPPPDTFCSVELIRHQMLRYRQLQELLSLLDDENLTSDRQSVLLSALTTAFAAAQAAHEELQSKQDIAAEALARMRPSIDAAMEAYADVIEATLQLVQRLEQRVRGQRDQLLPRVDEQLHRLRATRAYQVLSQS